MTITCRYASVRGLKNIQLNRVIFYENRDLVKTEKFTVKTSLILALVNFGHSL